MYLNVRGGKTFWYYELQNVETQKNSNDLTIYKFFAIV